MIVAVDFDGTLYSGNTPFPEVDIPGLNMKLIRTIEQLQANRPQDRYILWTCREGAEIDKAIDALNSVSSIRWDAINDNVAEVKATYGDPRKIIADIYIDDRSFTPFAGKLYLENIMYEKG